MDDHDPDKQYAVRGRIMLTAIVVLFAVVLFMAALHLYARWHLIRARRRQLNLRRQRRSQLSLVPLAAPAAADRGLDVTILNSLPVFLHSSTAVEECAVCLSEFEDKEIIRLLPKCNHTFHIGCIDMWFHSHSTCPLCRSPVEMVDNQTTPESLNSSIPEGIPSPPPSPLSLPPPSLGDRRKFLELSGVRIDVPPPETGTSHHQSSPAGRLLNRILSMGRKSPAASRGSTNPGRVREELDVESGGSGELNRGLT